MYSLRYGKQLFKQAFDYPLVECLEEVEALNSQRMVDGRLVLITRLSTPVLASVLHTWGLHATYTHSQVGSRSVFGTTLTI
jgi:hypothetical protein